MWTPSRLDALYQGGLGVWWRRRDERKVGRLVGHSDILQPRPLKGLRIPLPQLTECQVTPF